MEIEEPYTNLSRPSHGSVSQKERKEYQRYTQWTKIKREAVSINRD